MRTFWDKQPVPQEGLNYKRGGGYRKRKEGCGRTCEASKWFFMESVFS